MLSLKDLTATEIKAGQNLTLLEIASPLSRVKNWVAKSKRGRRSTNDEHCSEYPKTATVPNMSEKSTVSCWMAVE